MQPTLWMSKTLLHVLGGAVVIESALEAEVIAQCPGQSSTRRVVPGCVVPEVLKLGEIRLAKGLAPLM